jgi:uncharacterized secreted protein with C-terminal beta-propeller domain
MNKHRWVRPALMLVAMSLAGLVACSDDAGYTSTQDSNPQGEPPIFITSESALRSFDSCGDLQARMQDVVLETLVKSRYDVYRGLESDAGNNGSAPSAEGDGGGNEGPSDHSTTNNQEVGVDEADLVKTDGEFIYLAQGTELAILRSWPAEQTEKVGGLELGGYARSLFVEGDRALVFSDLYNDGGAQDALLARSWSASRATLVDLSDRENPRVVRQIDVEGWMANARLIDGRAHFVINSWFNLPQELWNLAWSEDLALPELDWNAPQAEQDLVRAQARELLRPRVEELVARLPIETWLPLHRDALGSQEGARVSPLLGCDQILAPATLSEHGMLNLVSLDLRDDEAALQATGIYSNGWQLYASQDNLYVAQSSNWWWWGWGAQPEIETHIHKFSLGDTPRYEASGSVPGWTLNQFAFSEHEGYLRVATSDGFNWWGGAFTDVEDTDNDGDTTETIEPPTPANNVFVMDQKRGQLGIVGQARGIAPGEQIYAARMMGDKGYVVTFRQTDPLFTLDLSDPFNPHIVGELHIPGYSSYLHPLGEDHLLAVGRAGDEDGTIRGIQLRVFDVSDPAHPHVAQEHELALNGWSWSESEWDHHAFTFHRNVLSIPLDTWHVEYDDRGNYTGGEYFSGLVVFSVDLTRGISELGRVDHSDLARRQACPYTGQDRAYCDDFYRYNWSAQLRRSVYIEDNLFSISALGVKVSDLYDPSHTLTSVMLAPER